MADEPVDLSRMTDIFGDNPEFLNELYTTYIDEGSVRMDELGNAVEAQNTDNCSQLAHAIKGASANVGATRVQAIADDLEKQGNNGDIIGAAEAFGALQSEFDAARNFLSGFLATLNAS